MSARTRRPVATTLGLVLLAALPGLVGCSSESESPAEPAPTSAGFAAGSPDGTAAEAAMESEAKNLATAQETYFVDQGGYAEDVDALDFTPTGEVRSMTVDDSSFQLCLVDTATGAWAAYDSADGGITGTGAEGGECTS